MPEDPARLRAAYEERARVLEELVERRQRELAILSEVAARVHAAETVPEIYEIALTEILDQLGLRAAWIFTGDERERRLELAAARGVAAAYLEEVRTQGLGECLCPEVFWSGHRMQVRNTTQCPRMPAIVEGLREPVAHACVPLKIGEVSKGVLNVAARPGELFSEEELRFLETLGHQVCLAVERAQNRSAERQRYQEGRALAAITKAIGGSLDVTAVLKAVGETARELVGAERARILLGSNPQDLRVAHLSGLPQPGLVEGQALDLLEVGASLQVLALQTRQGVWATDWAQDPRANPELARRWDSRAGIISPLLAGDRVLGLLVLTRPRPHAWTEEQLELADALADHAAVALENARLYQEARDAYDDLLKAQQRMILQESMAALGTFASGLAHEVRNPLNSISLQLAVLERRIGRMPDGARAEMMELAVIIREEIRRLDGLVGDFLQFSRATRLEPRPADLDRLADEVVRLLRPEAAAAGVTLSREAGGDPLPPVPLDAERMKQVVINLIRNAIEALPDGGRCVVETGLVEGRARLSVRDDGPGLPPDLDVFQLFVTTKAKGTGLGLPIVQQIVAQHGGDVRAQSVPGGGTAFQVELPLEAPVASAEVGRR